MICTNCRTRNCPNCKSVSCTCGHDDSMVRPLTSQERHDYTLGRHSDVVRPAGSLERPREVLVIRSSHNGHPTPGENDHA